MDLEILVPRHELRVRWRKSGPPNGTVRNALGRVQTIPSRARRMPLTVLLVLMNRRRSARNESDPGATVWSSLDTP